MIKGWQEALVLMKPGAKWQLFVPPELGYGASPKPGIPGGSLLIFDVELLSVKPSGCGCGTARPGHRRRTDADAPPRTYTRPSNLSGEARAHSVRSPMGGAPCAASA